MTTHLDRKALKRPDAFLERAGGAMGFVHENLRTIAAVVVLLFAAGLGLIFYNNHVEHLTEAADSSLYDATKVLTDSVAKFEKAKTASVAKAGADKPAAGADTADWAEATKPAVERLEKVAAEFNGTRAAFEANLILGDLFIRHGDAERALPYYLKGVDNAHPRAVKPAALYALAYAYEKTKKYDDAIAALHQVVASESAAFKADALLALGRNFTLKGDKSKALDAFAQVTKDYPNSPMAKQAELAGSRVR